MAHIWHNLKDIFDVVEGLPGLAAFIKVFFGSEAGQKKMEERFLKDVRDELFEDIRLLGEGHRENLVRRLHEAELRGEEDKLVWNLCKIKREVRRDALDFLDSLGDQEFKVMVDLLDDDKFHQFAVRMIRFFREEVAPIVARSFKATKKAGKKKIKMVKKVLPTKRRIEGADRRVARKLNQFAVWMRQ